MSQGIDDVSLIPRQYVSPGTVSSILYCQEAANIILIRAALITQGSGVSVFVRSALVTLPLSTPGL